jgi:hypothetical protein
METDVKRRQDSPRERTGTGRRRSATKLCALAVGLGFAAIGATSAKRPVSPLQDGGGSSSLGETRLTMDKWIETQQIISKERKDWQQGKEILAGRIELIQHEVSTLEAKIEQAKSAVTEAEKKRAELMIETDALKATGAHLAEVVTGMEGELRKLLANMPEPIQTKLLPLSQRIPDDPATTKVAVAERFQNVLGALSLINNANNEISVVYEVHTLADGKPSEVQAIYVGLAQAYYVSASGEAGIGRPSESGWKWEPSKAIAADVLKALEILQNKHSPAFVPLPVTIQ